METKTYRTIDRTGWPKGPWDQEPDKIQWPDHATGFPCLAVRHSDRGHWCGYVAVPGEHPLFGKNYEAPDVEVHGGCLTYARACDASKSEAEGICHVPGPGESDHVWWFGFDCAHAWDYSPYEMKLSNERGFPFTIGREASYKTLEYVKQQCKELAAQLAAVKTV